MFLIKITEEQTFTKNFLNVLKLCLLEELVLRQHKQSSLFIVLVVNL